MHGLKEACAGQMRQPSCDISMDETHVCVVDRDGAVVYEGKSASTAEAIADELAKAPSCRRIVFETGRMLIRDMPFG